MTLELAVAVELRRRLTRYAFVIRLPKTGVQLLSIYKVVNGLRQSTNASMEQLVEHKADVDLI